MVWKLGKSLYEKVMAKKRCKKVCGPALHTDKNFITNWFLVCKLGVAEKRWRLRTYFFGKTTGISRFAFFPLEILNKKKLHSCKFSKTMWHLLGMKRNSLWFFFIAAEVLVISYLDQGNSTFYFFNIPRKFKFLNS